MEKATEEIQRILSKAAKAKLYLLDRVFGKDFDANRSVIIYGAGILGGELADRLVTEKIITLFFIDKNIKKKGTLHRGIPVKHINDVRGVTNAYIVIATRQGYDEIESLLCEKKLDIGNKIIRLNHDIDIAAAIASPTHETLKGLRSVGRNALLETLLKDRSQIEFVYSRLSDHKSKKIFTTLLACLVDHNNLELLGTFLKNYSEPVALWGEVALFGYPESICYFNNELINLAENDFLVDVGAYDGCSTEAFLRKCKENNLSNVKSLAFEPDPDTFQVLAEKFINNEAVEVRNVAIWSKKTKLSFKSSKNAELKSSSGVNDEGDITVEAISIDQLNLNKISIIKADPPGLDVAIEVLKGGVETINRLTPKLIFPGYHSFDAIYRMPYIIEKLFPDKYNIFIRHLSWSLGETDIFAIPK